MAVVTKYGSKVITLLDAEPPVFPAKGLNGGRVHYATDKVEIASGDSSTSTFTLARIPYDAVILPGSLLYHDAITSVTDADIGTSDDPNGLADALDISSAGSKQVLEQVDIANYYKPLWELVGLTSNPGGLADIIVTINNNAGAAGTLSLHLQYVTS